MYILYIIYFDVTHVFILDYFTYFDLYFTYTCICPCNSHQLYNYITRTSFTIGTLGFSPVFLTENQRMSKGHKKCHLTVLKFVFLISLENSLVWEVVEIEYQIQKKA